MNDKIHQFLIGASGIGLTEVVQNSTALDPSQITTAGNLIIQLIIGIVTLFGLFKRKKNAQ